MLSAVILNGKPDTTEVPVKHAGDNNQDKFRARFLGGATSGLATRPSAAQASCQLQDGDEPRAVDCPQGLLRCSAPELSV